MAKYTPTEEEKKRWGITGKRKGGPGRRVHDWDLYRDIVAMPRRDSLPQDGPETTVFARDKYGRALDSVDSRSSKRQAWDRRMSDLQLRLLGNRWTEAVEKTAADRKAVVAEVTGLPVPADESTSQEASDQINSKTATADSQGPTLGNGQPKAGQPAAAQPPTRPGALKPKKEPVGPGATRRYGLRAGTGDISWDGTPVPKNFSAARNNLEGVLTAETGAARDRAEAAAQVQRAVSSHAPSEAYQASMDERERIEQMGKDRRARQAAEREAAAKRRADKRFADRTLYNEADWKNLGREGSNKADYSKDRLAGETDDQFNARQKLVTERQGRMDALLKRLDDMGVQDAEKNSFYANDPNKQQNLARLRGLIVGDDGKVRGDITDAQIEGANATLDAWKKGADEKGARQKAFTDMKNAEEVSQLRQKYGLNYGEFTADQVRDYHQRRQTEERKRILSRMQVAPGLTPELEQAVAHTALPGGDGRTPVTSYSVERKDMRPAAMAKFAQDWQALLDTGFDPTTKFQELMQQDDLRKAFQAGLDTIPLDDPDRADKRDQLRRRMILQYAMVDAGLKGIDGDEGKPGQVIGYGHLGTPEQLKADSELNDQDNVVYGQALAKNLPGKSILAPTRGAAEAVAGALQPKQPQQTPGVQVFTNPADALKARNDLNATAGIKPRQQARLRPGDKREETMAW